MKTLHNFYTYTFIVFLILLIAVLVTRVASGDGTREKKYKTLSVAELSHWLNSDRPFILVDSRSRNAYEASHIEGAINLPMGAFDDMFRALPKDRTVAIICYYGLFSQVAAQKLIQNSYSEVYSVAGGMRAWSK
ncbi:MAG: rhodanese-like domain-containing protein, partial [Gammaproteobacteria bacterium]